MAPCFDSLVTAILQNQDGHLYKHRLGLPGGYDDLVNIESSASENGKTLINAEPGRVNNLASLAKSSPQVATFLRSDAGILASLPTINSTYFDLGSLAVDQFWLLPKDNLVLEQAGSTAVSIQRYDFSKNPPTKTKFKGIINGKDLVTIGVSPNRHILEQRFLNTGKTEWTLSTYDPSEADYLKVFKNKLVRTFEGAALSFGRPLNSKTAVFFQASSKRFLGLNFEEPLTQPTPLKILGDDSEPLSIENLSFEGLSDVSIDSFGNIWFSYSPSTSISRISYLKFLKSHNAYIYRSLYDTSQNSAKCSSEFTKEGQTTEANMNLELSSSLASMCIGKITTLQVSDSCLEDRTGELKITFSHQAIASSTNQQIVLLKRSCQGLAPEED